MQISTAEITTWLGTFIWPLLRISAMLIAVPVFSSRMMPARIRVLLALVLTATLAPTLPSPPPPVEALSAEGLLIGTQQMLIGFVMGFALQLAFSAVAFGGQIIAYSMGLGFASMIDPANGVQVPVVSQYFIILTTLIFLLLNGHLVLIEMLAESFRTLPIATEGITQNDLWLLIEWGAHVFAYGLLIALPAITALLLVNVTFGVVTRAAPQLNIFAVGFPVSMLLGFWILWATLPSIFEQFEESLDSSFMLLHTILKAIP